MSEKVKNIVVVSVFLLVLICFMVVNIVKEDTAMSLTERRELAKFPEFSFAKLMDKSFFDQFDKYTMDQFIDRDGFRSFKTFVELNIFHKKDVNNVYVSDGVLVKQEYPLDEKSLANMIQKIKELQTKCTDETNNVYFSIIPDKNYFMDDDYLKMDYAALETKMIQNLKGMEYINLFDCLDLKDYYYTDTHWKQENLSKVLDRISSQMNFKDRLQTDFIEKDVTDFKGVYTGQLQVKTKEDRIKVLTNDVIENATVYNFEEDVYSAVYNLEKLEKTDKYDIFLSGATPLLVIDNPAATTEKELVVFRDSFGSSLIPLFIEGYKKITVVDTRYIAAKYVNSYVDFKNKDVLFIYSTLVINGSSALK